MSEGHFEAKVSGKRESSNGIFLTLQIQPDDFKADLAVLRVGAHLMLGWSEVINTAVEPVSIVDHADFSGVTDIMRGTPAKDRRKFSDLPLCQQAALRGEDRVFQEWAGCKNAAEAADYIRQNCDVDSKSKIVPGSEAAMKFDNMEMYFQAWLTDRIYAEAKR